MNECMNEWMTEWIYKTNECKNMKNTILLEVVALISSN